MPKEFGAWPAVRNRFRRCRDAGVFAALLRAGKASEPVVRESGGPGRCRRARLERRRQASSSDGTRNECFTRSRYRTSDGRTPPPRRRAAKRASRRGPMPRSGRPVDTLPYPKRALSSILVQWN
ncbi:hypothetical protein CA984_19780 [Streptosporangium minutum]|uniref:Transposase n=1 Tax=Streptosporangium minutum TaxID=569862 RepID=A0A243RJS0_9ACTN|nr:hypothetical protein CA984_19780 [Streptosporangium minutum]